MTIPDINSLRDDLLTELAKRRATNGRPANAKEVCSELRPDWDWDGSPELARSAGWLLVKNVPPLAKKVTDSERPGAMLLALTAAGRAEASRIYIARKPPTFRQRFKAMPIGKGVWEVIKLALAAVAGAAAKSYFG